MKAKKKLTDMQTNADLRRFCLVANKRYFGDKLQIAKIEFSAKVCKSSHGRMRAVAYEQTWVSASGLPPRKIEKEMQLIFIHPRLRRWRDLCMMTVYHEMVHAELDMLGFYGKEGSCRKSGFRFNRRMTELAQAGAFNGLW
jgi:hypothetical protein